MNQDITPFQTAVGGFGLLAMVLVFCFCVAVVIAGIIMPIVVLLINAKMAKMVVLVNRLLEWEQWKASVQHPEQMAAVPPAATGKPVRTTMRRAGGG
jgi:hypothetical protein